jgi:3',5'-cyclic AMP phosphodiesterase CpdA
MLLIALSMVSEQRSCSVPDMRILHLSDTHLDRTDSPNADGVNARQSLRQMLGDLEAVRDIDVVVISGDISGDRSEEAYHAARELIVSSRGAGTFRWSTALTMKMRAWR